ncbi:MAG: thioesterase family protein, partial [Pseudomonadota bacterium]
MTAQSAPFASTPLTIEPDWIDYNGHLNMAFYMVLFDTASDQAFAHLGLGPDYAKSRHHTTYTAEAHIRYIQEVHESDPMVCTLQLIAHDEKRMHTWQELRHAEENWLAATNEMITLHVDMSGPRVAAMPDDISDNVNTMARAHAELPLPDGLGRQMGIPIKA